MQFSMAYTVMYTEKKNEIEKYIQKIRLLLTCTFWFLQIFPEKSPDFYEAKFWLKLIKRRKSF